METTDNTGAKPATYAFGAFQFAARDRSLTGPDGPVRLTPKAADLLLALLRSMGHVVGKEELIQQVWPETFVADTNLTFQINRLRSALGDPAGSPTYIETVPGIGYKWICPVTFVPIEGGAKASPAAAEEVPADEHPNRVATPRRRHWPWVIAAATVIAAVAGVSLVESLEPPPPRLSRVSK